MSWRTLLISNVCYLFLNLLEIFVVAAFGLSGFKCIVGVIALAALCLAAFARASLLLFLFLSFIWRVLSPRSRVRSFSDSRWGAQTIKRRWLTSATVWSCMVCAIADFACVTISMTFLVLPLLHIIVFIHIIEFTAASSQRPDEGFTTFVFRNEPSIQEGGEHVELHLPGAVPDAVEHEVIGKLRQSYPAILEPTCHICLEDFQEGEIIGQPHCRHLFHASCLSSWQSHKKSVALCPFRCTGHELPA